MSQGYGVTLIAETSSGRFISTERCISGAELLRCREEQIVPDDIGQQAACALLDEVKRCVLCPLATCSLAACLLAVRCTTLRPDFGSRL